MELLIGGLPGQGHGHDVKCLIAGVQILPVFRLSPGAEVDAQTVT